MIAQLLSSRRFLPLFITQFGGALNDNIFKNALVIFIIFTLAADHAAFYATLAAGIFILPFVVFSPYAGALADRHDKARIMQIVKLAEVIIMLMGVAAFYLHSSTGLLLVLFLMGVHSAFFSPAKYSILPQHVSADELVAANGLLSTGTFVAILLGTIIGTLGIMHDAGTAVIAGATMLCAGFGAVASFYIPPAPPASSSAGMASRPFKDCIDTLRMTLADRATRMPAIGISWFWFLGATYLAQFPHVVKTVLGADEKIVTLFLVMFTLGVAVGSMLCGKILKDKVSAKLAPVAALGLAVFGTDFYFAVQAGDPLSPRLLVDLFMTAVAGGMFYVPLYAVVQDATPLDHRARVMAGISLLNAVFMVFSSLMGMLILGLGFSGLAVILVAVGMSPLMAIYTSRQ